MKLTLDRINDAVLFQGTDGHNRVLIDGTPEIGGKDLGLRPMQLLAIAVASCASMDVIHVLKKQKVVLADYKVHVDAERPTDKAPAPFRKIKLIFAFAGEGLSVPKLQRAVQLGMDYCSVSKSLSADVEVTTEITLNGTPI